MCHAFLSESRFYQFLFRIDQEIADQVRLKGCAHCGGRLHVADSLSPPSRTACGPLSRDLAHPPHYEIPVCAGMTAGEARFLLVRGKVNKTVEFGSKLSVSLTDAGLARVDHLRWDAFHEGLDLPSQVEAYRKRTGYYPESVRGDPIYGTRDNRDHLKRLGIRFAGKPLGRPRQVTEANREELKRLKAQRREEYLQRIPIVGKFGQGKNGYRLNYIRAKRADTSSA